MNKAKLAALALAVVAIGAAWYAFRPERLWIDQVVHEAPPTASTASAAVEAEGQFHSVAHESRGKAQILRLPNGDRVLRFTDFATSNGPDVRVYLVAATDAHDNATVREAKTLELGALKGNIGEQNYELASDIDLDEFRAVTIWCKRFSVNFATAPLSRLVTQR
jgi:hypothetical protein